MLRRSGPSALRQQARNSRARLSSAPTLLPAQHSVESSPSKEGIVRLDIDALLDESSPALLLDQLQVALHRSPPMLGEEFPQSQQQQQADLDLTPTPPQPPCFESMNMDHSDEDLTVELPSLPRRQPQSQPPPAESLPPKPSKPLPPLPLRHSHKRQISRDDSASGIMNTPKAGTSPRTPPSKPPVSSSRRYIRSDSVTNSEASTCSSSAYSSGPSSNGICYSSSSSSDPSTAPTSPASSPRSIGSGSSHKYYRSSPRMRSNSDFSLLSSVAGSNSEAMLRSSSEGSAKTFASNSSSSGSSMAGSERSWEQDFTSSVWTKSHTFASPTSASFAPSASSSSSAGSVAAANGLPAPSQLFGGDGGASRPASGISTSQTTAKAKASLDYEEEQAGSTFEDDDTKSTSKCSSSASSAKSMKSKRSIGNLGKWFRRKPSLGDLKASPKSHHHEPMPTRAAVDVQRR